jgi:phosphoribosyl 1,2-cyclic phosphate phosphodiesterase
MGEMELLFLGTGTSAGIPMIGCHCPVCTSSDSRDRRSRPSVLIGYDGVQVLVDAAPELRLQCVANHVESIDAVVFTHGHADHIMGLDDVRRFNTIRGGALDVWADQRTSHALQNAFGYAFRPPDPSEQVYRPHLNPRSINGPFEIGGRQWRPLPLFHGEMPVLGFRVGAIAYCTDVSRIPEETFDMLRGLELLVIDGLQPHPHPTHFSISQALLAAGRIQAKRTYLTHMAHHVSHAQVSATLPAGVELAWDGLRVKVVEATQ